jgi:SAM-dependent methyltransferase
MVEGAGLDPKERILEIGAGLGKFTIPLAERGFSVVANDLSPVLLGRLTAASKSRVETLCCDVVDLDRHTREHFDKIIGFFVLHHLDDFETIFAALARVLVPGGRVAFCEPVAWNPLYYAQILLTPSMHFNGEPSLSSMRPDIILPALCKTGFTEAQAHGYGYLPPIIKNISWGDEIEQWLDGRSFVPFPHAFQLFTATLPR